MTKPLFNEQIKPAILEQLSKAKKSILVVIAWFNDTDIFELLINKAINSDILIKIILSEEDEENNINAQLPFQKLLDANDNIYIFKIPKDAVMVHQKFCIVDGKNCISGSYNWTFGASSKNLENVLLIENDEKVCKPFIDEFDRIFDEYCKPIINSSTEKLKELFQEIQNSIEHGNIRLAINVDDVVKNIKSNFLTPENSENIDEESFESFNDPITIDSPDELIIKWWELLPQIWKTFFLRYCLKVDLSKKLDLLSIKNLFTSIENLKIQHGTMPNIIDFDGIKNLSFIKTIRAVNCSILSLNGIQNFQYLKKLELGSNNLFSLNEINGLPNLEYIDVSNNKITSLDSLIENTSVKKFYFENNPCTTLKGIENFKSLEHFTCDTRFEVFPIELERINKAGLVTQSPTPHRSITKLIFAKETND